MDEDARAKRVLEAVCLLVAIVLAGLILILAPCAHGQSGPVRTSCTASEYSVFNAKAKKEVPMWRAACTARRGDEVVLRKDLVLAEDATRIEALVEIDRWMREDLPKLLEEKGIKTARKHEESKP